MYLSVWGGGKEQCAGRSYFFFGGRTPMGYDISFLFLAPSSKTSKNSIQQTDQKSSQDVAL